MNQNIYWMLPKTSYEIPSARDHEAGFFPMSKVNRVFDRKRLVPAMPANALAWTGCGAAPRNRTINSGLGDLHMDEECGLPIAPDHPQADAHLSPGLVRNKRVQDRYDELMRLGKHGHYETLFQVVREEIERDRQERA